MLIRWGGGGSPAISPLDADLLSISLRVWRGMTAGGKLIAQPVSMHFQELPSGLSPPTSSQEQDRTV
jgi:hypothetical protein